MRTIMVYSFIVIMFLSFHLIFAFFVTALSVLYSNIFSTKIPIGLPIVIAINITALLGYMTFLIGFLEFVHLSYYSYIQAWEFMGGQVAIYGSIVGLLTYVSSRLWRNGRSRVRIIISALLVIVCLILLAIGLAYISLIGFMVAADW